MYKVPQINKIMQFFFNVQTAAGSPFPGEDIQRTSKYMKKVLICHQENAKITKRTSMTKMKRQIRPDADESVE